MDAKNKGHSCLLVLFGRERERRVEGNNSPRPCFWMFLKLVREKGVINPCLDVLKIRMESFKN